MKTIVCFFPSVDYGDLAAKELKERGLVKNNIEIEGIDLDSEQEHFDEELNYFLLPALAINYNTSFVFPLFPAFIPYMNDSMTMNSHNEHDDEKVIFCAKCREEDVSVIESIILNHSGFDFKVISS